MMFLRFGVWASVWNALPLSDPTVPVDFLGRYLKHFLFALQFSQTSALKRIRNTVRYVNLLCILQCVVLYRINIILIIIIICSSPILTIGAKLV